MLNGSVAAIVEGAAFRCARSGMEDLETTVTALFGVLDSVTPPRIAAATSDCGTARPSPRCRTAG